MLVGLCVSTFQIGILYFLFIVVPLDNFLVNVKTQYLGDIKIFKQLIMRIFSEECFR